MQVLSAILVALLVGTVKPSMRAGDLVPVTRAEIISRAQEMAQFEWTTPNFPPVAKCLSSPSYTGPTYSSDYRPGDSVVGLPYDWGGMDTTHSFMDKIQHRHFGAGSHSWNECSRCGHCTTGIDCSGYVSYCWRLSRHYGTSEMNQVSHVLAGSQFDIRKDLKPGDALNSVGHHIVLFKSYEPNGYPLVCESSGSARRVICQSHPWAYFSRPSESFIPIRYIAVRD